MKWIAKPKPKEGEWFRSFAYLPVECEGGETVWLEPVMKKVYIGNSGGDVYEAYKAME